MHLDYDMLKHLQNIVIHKDWGNHQKYDVDFFLPIYLPEYSSIIPIPNAYLPFDKSQYEIDESILNKLTSPSEQDLEILLSGAYEKVNE